MPQPELPGVEVVLTMLQANGDVAQNVLHFLATEPTGPSQREDLADAIASEWRDHLQGLQSTQVSLFGIKVSEMSSAPWASTVKEYNEAAEMAGTALPPQLAIVTSLFSTGPGRRGRGRIFHGGWTVDALTSSGNVDLTTREACTTFVDVLIGGLTAGGITFQLAVWSRADDALYGCTDSVTDNRWDVQRRRANRRVL